MTRANTKVAIVWSPRGLDSDGDLSLSFLAYNGGNGSIRVYYKDRYDARAGANLPFFNTWRDARRFLLTSPPLTSCQVAIDAIVRARICELHEFDSEVDGAAPCTADGARNL